MRMIEKQMEKYRKTIIEGDDDLYDDPFAQDNTPTIAEEMTDFKE